MKKLGLIVEMVVVFIIILALIIFLWHKFNISQNEAQMSKSVRSLAILLKDIDNYYVKNNNFNDIALMSKIGLNKHNWFFIKSEQCLHFNTFKDYLVIKKTENPGPLCKKLLTYDSVVSLLVGKDSPSDNGVNTNINQNGIIYKQLGKKNNATIL